jgi:acyl dehydratase
MIKVGQSVSVKKVFSQADFDEFAALSGDDNPIHVDPAFAAKTKFGRTVAHGMLLYGTILQVLGERLPGPGTVQQSQELIFPSPTYVGEEVSVQLTVTALPDPDSAEIGTKIVRPNGEFGCDGKTIVTLPGSKTPWVAGCYEPKQYGDTAQTHAGLKLGQSASLQRTFGREELSRFLCLTGNDNPIFFDIDYAQERGFANVLLPGGLLGGMASTLLGTRLPGRGTNWLKQSYYFLGPAHPGEEITASAEIIRLRPEKDLVNLRTTLWTARNDKIVDGEALVWVSDLEQLT